MRRALVPSTNIYVALKKYIPFVIFDSRKFMLAKICTPKILLCKNISQDFMDLLLRFLLGVINQSTIIIVQIFPRPTWHKTQNDVLFFRHGIWLFKTKINSSTKNKDAIFNGNSNYYCFFRKKESTRAS